jgi:hypothetical protein
MDTRTAAEWIERLLCDAPEAEGRVRPTRRRGLRAVGAVIGLLAMAACASPFAVDEKPDTGSHTTSSGNHTTSSANLTARGR